jgi:hypothetical protein
MKILDPLLSPEGDVGTVAAPPAVAPVAPAVVPASNDDGGSTLSPDAVEDLLKVDVDDDTIGTTPDAPIVVAPAVPPVKPAAPVTPVTPPAVAPVVPPVVATPEPPKPPVVEPAKPAPAPAVAKPPTPPVVPAVVPPVAPVVEKTPEQLQADIAARRQEFRSSLVKLYEPTTKDKGGLLLTEPEKVLPELAAELHMQVLESAVYGIMAQVPQIVQNVIAMQHTTERNEASFFAAWPQLAAKKVEAMPLITRFAPIYRQANPSASMEDFTREVGSMVMVALRIAPTGAVEPPPATPPAVFAPAVPGAGGAPPTGTPAPKNQWEQLQEEFLQEDRMPN